MLADTGGNTGSQSATLVADAKLKFDPAVVASPALTTLVDITGLLIFFATIKLFLGI